MRSLCWYGQQRLAGGSTVISSAEVEALRAAHLKSWGRANRSRLNAVLKYAGPSILDVGCSTGACLAHLSAAGHSAYGLGLLLDELWSQREPGLGEWGRIRSSIPGSDFLALRSFPVPFHVAHFASRILRRPPFRARYRMPLLAVARRL